MADSRLAANVLVLGLLLNPPALPACTYALVTLDMPRTFKLIVHDNQDLTKGLEVIVEKRPPEGTEETEEGEEEVVLRGFTDSRGEFEVKDLPPGEYYISVGGETEFGWASVIRVTAASQWRDRKIVFVSWVPDEIVRVRRFEGVLIYQRVEPDESPKPVIDGAIVIKNAKSRQILREVKASPSGSFAIAGLPPGLYAVHTSARAPVPPSVPHEFRSLFKRVDFGTFALEISLEPDALDTPVEISMAFTSCGVDNRVRALRSN